MKNQVLSFVTVLTSRFSGLPANFSMLGGYGFFGNNWWLYGASIVTHDWLRGGFYPGFWLTYVGFAVYALLGRVARQHWQRQVVLLPIASLLFFFFSNLGVWWYWYPHTPQALIMCFTLALPFYRNTFLSDLGFGYGYLLTRCAWRYVRSRHVHAELVIPSSRMVRT